MTRSRSESCPDACRETQYEVNNGLQVVENWNSTNEFICYGRQGEMATNSREQQETTTLSLQLLQNCLMLINTILIQRTVDRQGLLARLQPEANPRRSHRRRPRQPGREASP